MKKPLICFLAAVTSVYIGSAGINVSAIMEPGDVTYCVYRSDDDSEVVIVPEKTDDGKVINEVYLEDDPGIKKVVLPDTVNEVEVIRCTGITEFSVSENNPYLSVVDGILYDKDQKMLMCYPAGKTDTEFHIPETVEVVGKCAFAGDETLEKVYIPSSVRKIENSAFAEMKAKEFIFSEGVTDIEKYAFYECTELEKITLPASLERIERPFEECQKLKEIIVTHTGYKGNGPSAIIDPEKDNYMNLIWGCKDVLVYVPDVEFENYKKEIFYLEEKGTLHKFSELPNTEVKTSLGDIDASGNIDVTDLTELSLALLGDRELTDDQQKAADVDADGAVTLADLARLRQYLSKKITAF